MHDFDPIALSRTLGRAEDEAWAWLDRLSELAVQEDAPLQAYRTTLCQQYYAELHEELHASDPLKPYLVRWLSHLIELRVNGSMLIESAHLRHHNVYHLELPDKLTATLDTVCRKVLAEERRGVWLKELDRVSQPVADLTTHLWQRRVEVYNRLKGPSLDEVELPTAETYAIANDVLSSTQALVTEMPGLVKAMAHMVKPGALTFPAHLSPATLGDWFRETRLLEAVHLRQFNWPKSLAPSSFGVALDRFGAVWQRALAPRNQPFVVAYDPLALGESTTGWLFANLLANPTFQRRNLGGAPSKQRDVNRFWGFMGVHELRLRALRVLTRQAVQLDYRERPKALEHLSERVWGEPLGRNLLGVLPQLRASDPQRLCAVGLATLRAESLTEAHNEDWFRNPRAIDELRSTAAIPPEFTVAAELVKDGLGRCIASLGKMIG
jgi:hypothetical protein